MRLVINKIDLPSAWDATKVDALRVSAATGEGIAELLAALGGWLVPEVPPPGAGVPLVAEQMEEIAGMLGAMPSAS